MKSFIILFFLITLSLPVWAGDAKESAYDRVMRTQTIRCGYGVSPPYVVKDINTGEVSGLYVDIINEMGAVLNLKIDWAQEIAWDQMTLALNSNKIDVVCSGLWVAASRGRSVAYTDPIIFNAVDIFVRADDTRFDNHPEKINDPSITIATDDGGLAEEIARNDFPLAKILRAPQMAPATDLLMNVMTKKADVTFNNASYISEFEKMNPKKLRAVKTNRPIRFYHNSLAVDIHELELREVLNSAITELEGSGKIDKIMNKYSSKDYPDILYRTAKPYELKK
jgi:ABC-type amino acid transport substrate-binding protein